MATYIDIHGNNIPIVSSDPTNPIVGEVWYNTTTKALKGQKNVATASWSTSGAVPKQITGMGSGGTTTAAWAAGGLQYPGGTSNLTFVYDGSSWSSANDLPQNYFIGGHCGPNSAGLMFGSQSGYGTTTTTSEWDGTNWTGGGAFPSLGPSSAGMCGWGDSSNALSAGGRGDPPPAGLTDVYNYNGTAWTTNPYSLPVGQYNAAGSGTVSEAWMAGGYGPSPNTSTFTFNGSAWTAKGALNNARNEGQSGGFGPETAATIACGGPGPIATAVENFDGTSWTAGTNLSTARTYGMGASRNSPTQTNGYIVGGATGSSPSFTGATEEYSAPGPATVTFTSS